MTKTIAVVPARMGSARMPRKNLCEIEPGLSLVQHAINCARYSGIVSEVIVSTDEHLEFDGAKTVIRPPELSGPTADISSAIRHATQNYDYDLVVTLQPAVLARSPLIVRRLVEFVIANGCNGGLTMAATHRWVWEIGCAAKNDWHPGPYPRSQDSAPRTVEVNAVQVASAFAVCNNARWSLPLAVAILPPWAAALDIDTPKDLAIARDLWPWAKLRLETCEPEMALTTSINGVSQ
jgi:DNA-binding transcriptional LysR family regulator